MKILVTGGAGFIGSHLCDYLVKKGHEVVCVDSFFSGKKENIAHLLSHPQFRLIAHDVRKPLKWNGELQRIYHLACPASPVQYQFDPVLTMETSILGTEHLLRLARRTGARLLFTSTSEVYGDPLEHPQKESYFGHVDPLGKRACYDEGKRAAETLCKDYREHYGVDARIVRLFNTYGPHMMFHDGRVLSNFILQALLHEPITVHGAGTQTRSFLYVADLLPALEERLETDSDDWRPVNLGNPDERRIVDLAALVKEQTGSTSRITHLAEEAIPNRAGDPQRRCPDISRAKTLLRWEPKTALVDGLKATIVDFRQRLNHRPHVIVFGTSYGPNKGPAERAVEAIIARSPEWEFDILAAKLDSSLPSESHDGRVHVYRFGRGGKFDKFLFPFRAAWFALTLHREHRYQVAWAIMASYGAMAATLFSGVFRTRVPFLLSVYEGSIEEKMLRRGRWLSVLYRCLFRYAHRWQVVGAMTEAQRAWLEDERHVQAVQLQADPDLLAKRTKEMFQELEILATRL